MVTIIKGNEDCIEYENKSSVKLIGRGLSVEDHGKNNKIYIGKGAILNGVSVYFGSDNNRIHIGENTRLTCSAILKIVPNNSLYIGNNTTMGGGSFICAEGCSVHIGADCMLAWDLEFRTTDSHAIIDVNSGKRINEAQSIKVEDHVWIGAHSRVLKGAVIKKNSIVSLGAVVTKAFKEEGVILGGIPAKVLRENVTWERPLLG